MAETFLRYTEKAVGTAAANFTYSPAVNNTTIVIGLSLSNILGTSITASASLWNGSTNVYLVKDTTLNPGQSIILSGGDQKIVLWPGDEIRVSSNTSASLDAVMSILQITATGSGGGAAQA